MQSIRPINICPGSFFVESRCTPQHDTPGSLQTYSITCAEYIEHRDPNSGELQQSNLVHRHRTGYCEMTEVCMTSFGVHWPIPHPRRYANCVGKSLFDGTMYGPGDGESKMRINVALQRGEYQSAYLVISQSDGTTPTEVDTFNIDTWLEDGETRSQKCRDCMDLQTSAIAPDLKALKAEARLLTTGAAAGILWLALMSG